ncbi:MAG: hypothetical protein IPP74_11465 [Alphaproteobacteria bacterium]|nr:hypothetical protein [Alphaproteobacteria bacterium]
MSKEKERTFTLSDSQIDLVESCFHRRIEQFLDNLWNQSTDSNSKQVCLEIVKRLTQKNFIRLVNTYYGSFPEVVEGFTNINKLAMGHVKTSFLVSLGIHDRRLNDQISNPDHASKYEKRAFANVLLKHINDWRNGKTTSPQELSSSAANHHANREKKEPSHQR